MPVRPICLLWEQNYYPGGNRGFVKVPGLRAVGGKGHPVFWPREVIQKSPPLWAPPGLAQKPTRQKASSRPSHALEMVRSSL